jgi:hypothetical protein
MIDPDPRTLDPIYEAPFDEPVHGRADRAGRKVHFWTDGTYWQRPNPNLPKASAGFPILLVLFVLTSSRSLSATYNALISAEHPHLQAGVHQECTKIPVPNHSGTPDATHGNSSSMRSSDGMTFTTGPFQNTDGGASFQCAPAGYRIASSQ